MPKRDTPRSQGRNTVWKDRHRTCTTGTAVTTEPTWSVGIHLRFQFSRTASQISRAKAERKAVGNPLAPRRAIVELGRLRCGPSTVAGIESHLIANRPESGNGLPQATPGGVPTYTALFRRNHGKHGTSRKWKSCMTRSRSLRLLSRMRSFHATSCSSFLPWLSVFSVVNHPGYGSSSVAAISRWSEPLALPTKQLRTRQVSSARMWSRRIHGTPAGQQYCRVQGNE